MSQDAYHKGPPPVGSAWANIQETRVVLHTYGTHAHAYTVQFEVWRGFPDIRRCGTRSVNGQSWRDWVRYAQRTAHPADSGRDVGDREPGSTGDSSQNRAMEGRPSVASDNRVVGPAAPNAPIRRETDRSGVVHLAPKQQRKKDGDR